MNPERQPIETFWEREREQEKEKCNRKQGPLYKPIENLKKHSTNKPTRVSFESHWVPHSYGLLPIQAKLLNILWRKQQAGNIHVCKNEINNYFENIDLVEDL